MASADGDRYGDGDGDGDTGGMAGPAAGTAEVPPEGRSVEPPPRDTG
ncbi:hypothetical protein ACIA8F_12900 [Streptomyces sp. NPDC051563]